MSDAQTEQVRERLANELANAPQGTRDSQMPAPPDPNPGGQVGLNPSDETLAATVGLEQDPAKLADAEGQQPDPGVANAGGVDAPNTDGMTQATGRD